MEDISASNAFALVRIANRHAYAVVQEKWLDERGEHCMFPPEEHHEIALKTLGVNYADASLLDSWTKRPVEVLMHYVPLKKAISHRNKKCKEIVEESEHKMAVDNIPLGEIVTETATVLEFIPGSDIETETATVVELNSSCSKTRCPCYEQSVKNEELLQSIEFQVMDLRETVGELHKLVAMALGNKAVPTATKSRVACGKFPLKTMEQMGRMEVALEDPDFLATVLNELENLRAKDLKQTANLFMRYAFTDELGSKFNWTGAKKKAALQKTKIIATLMDVLNSRFPGQRNEAVAVLKSWLRNAPARSILKTRWAKIKDEG